MCAPRNRYFMVAPCVSLPHGKQYTNEFMTEAAKQVFERGFTVVDVAARIGIHKHTLYDWVGTSHFSGLKKWS